MEAAVPYNMLWGPAEANVKAHADCYGCRRRRYHSDCCLDQQNDNIQHTDRNPAQKGGERVLMYMAVHKASVTLNAAFFLLASSLAAAFAAAFSAFLAALAAAFSAAFSDLSTQHKL